jgi:hypothetical protein
VLITRSTWEPAATSTPSAGLLRMTDPSGTEGSGSRSIDPTLRSKLASVSRACCSVWPRSRGTATSPGPVETNAMSVEPCSTRSPLEGLQRMTRPS